jgi:hypothetical protein
VTCAPGDPDEDEGELADLGQADGDQQGRPHRVAKDPGHDRPYHKLAHDDQGDHHAQEREVGGDGVRVDEGADGHEEEGHEDVAKGQQSGQCFVGVVGPADEEAGQERPERQRQTDRLCHRGRSERDGQGDEQEELRVLQAGHAGEER